jgi:hypothetical protein
MRLRSVLAACAALSLLAPAAAEEQPAATMAAILGFLKG